MGEERRDFARSRKNSSVKKEESREVEGKISHFFKNHPLFVEKGKGALPHKLYVHVSTKRLFFTASPSSASEAPFVQVKSFTSSILKF